MKRACLIGLLSIGLLGTSAAPAAAGYDWWGWLEDFSGPGPFGPGPWPTVIAATVCRTDDRNAGVAPAIADMGRLLRDNNAPGIRLRKWVLGTPSTERALACFYGEYQRFVAPPDRRGFPEMSAQLVDIGVNYPLGPILDVGAGMGFMVLNPNDERTRNSTRFTITPVRMAFKPLLLAWPVRDHKAFGALKFVLKETYVAGRLSGVGLGATGPPASEFQSRGELLRSFALEVDASELLCSTAKRQMKWRWTRALGDCTATPEDTITVIVRDAECRTPLNGATVRVQPHAGQQGFEVPTMDGRVTLPAHPAGEERGLNDRLVTVSLEGYRTESSFLGEELTRVEFRLQRTMPQACP